MRLITHQKGLSLVELMIGVLLSSMLLLGVMQVFQSNTSTSRTQTAFSRIQESGRFAVDMLSKEIRAADFWGCAPGKDSIGNSQTGFLASVGADGIQGLNDVITGAKVGGMDVATGSDVLIIGSSVDACAGAGRMLDPANPLLPEVSENCPVEAGDVVLIANCRAGDVIAISGVTGALGDGNRVISHDAVLQESYGADSKILKPYQRTYFIAEGAAGSNSLFMRDENDNTQELVPGIEDMQVSYGRDTSDDGIVDIWQVAESNLDNMAQVTAVKLQLLVTSDEPAGVNTQTITELDGTETTYTDGKLRKLYVATVKVRNRGSM
ncbi:PilW family protein [Microbulbifer elongatus]|uniref:PilW family protein n=1 Tax=Microbulbifer elongatus TaxID=86173 RepID=A0ABT1P3T0_9GAMM|nr:PilW family protein [Microbulbifer elongatus]MCQ3830771.1 PilW family protein [Microbulbifer elongatus]